MKKLTLFFGFLLVIASCSKKEDTLVGSFQYTVSGAASANITGNETAFGTSNGELFIRLTAGVDELILQILIDPAAPGGYAVNPILVNMQNQPIVSGDSFADLGLGSVFNGNRRDFSTNAGDGGVVTLNNVSADVLEGSFNVSMLELLSGGTMQPEITVQGTFMALKQ